MKQTSSDLMGSGTVLGEKLANCQLSIHRDVHGQRVVGFSDGRRSYYLPNASFPEIDPVRDEVFFLTDFLAVLVRDSVPESGVPKMLLLRLHSIDNSAIAVALQSCRDELMQMLQADSRPATRQILGAINGSPDLAAETQPTTFVVSEPWKFEFVTERLSGERSDDFSERVSQLKNPLEVKNAIQLMPPELKAVLSGPGVVLKSIFLFTSFYVNADVDGQGKILEAFQEASRLSCGVEFVNAFSVCDVGWLVGNDILALAGKPNMKEVLCHCETLFGVQRDFLSPQIEVAMNLLGVEVTHDGHWKNTVQNIRTHLDKNVFSAVLMQKRAAFLKAASDGTLNMSLFRRGDVLLGALHKSLSADAFTQEGREAMETVMQGTTIRIVQGSPNLASSPDAMDLDSNYLDPERFCRADFENLTQYMVETFKGADPDLISFLKRQIFKDLTDPSVAWVFTRKNGRLIGAAKIRPDKDEDGVLVPGQYYFGTFYAAQEVQLSYGVGNVLSCVALSTIPEGSVVVGTCAPYNPVLELYIERKGAVVVGLTQEGDKKGLSGAQLKIRYDARNFEYSSKALSRQDIFALEQADLKEGASVCALRLSSDLDCQPAFLATLASFFEKGYVLTRLFYGQDQSGKPDLSQTHVVFEKAQSSDTSL
jgi:hypothetical protein